MDDIYQLKLEIDLPDESGSAPLSVEEIQAREDAARRLFESGSSWAKDADGNAVEPYNYDLYERLRAIKIPFRAAVLVMWLATPAKYRVPKTKKELADQLGLNSPRQFSVWMAKNKVLQDFVEKAWRMRAVDRLSDSLDAMYEVASQPNYKGKGDRELHFKLAGILSDKIDLNTNLPSNADLTKLPFDQKLKLAGVENAEDLAALRERLRKNSAEFEIDRERDLDALEDDDAADSNTE